MKVTPWMSAMTAVWMLVGGCDEEETDIPPASAVCDPCDEDADCASIPDQGIEGYSCVLGRCCENPAGMCRPENVEQQCGASEPR
jgi:hypothetical protein